MKGKLSLLLLVLLVPTGLAHDPSLHGPDGVPETSYTPETLPPSAGYTGPGRDPWISFFEGAWIYGQTSATPLKDQQPRNMRMWGDWIVWEDAARGDIYAYNVPAGLGQYLTQDRFLQRNPQIFGTLVVWEDYRNGNRAAVYGHFLDTGETRRLSTGSGNHRTPSVWGDLVAWEDDREGGHDIWAYNLTNRTEFPVAVDDARKSDPLVFGDRVYYRTYRFNVWDLMLWDPEWGTVPVTSDNEIQSAPFTNGLEVMYATRHESAWFLDRYDEVRERPLRTATRLADTERWPVWHDRMLMGARDVGYTQLVARNLTTGENAHVTGDLALVTQPVLEGNTAFAAVRTPNGTMLLTLHISPFAWAPQPKLVVTSPGSIAPWGRPLAVSGILDTGSAFASPSTFTYRLDDQPPQLIPAEAYWSFTVDPQGFAEGTHRLVIRASFREGPPVETVVALVVPSKYATVDVEQAAAAYHAQRVFGMLHELVLDNPASYFLLAFILVLVVVLAVRLWLAWRAHRGGDVLIEYVPPE